jgi:hypothetical protein
MWTWNREGHTMQQQPTAGSGGTTGELRSDAQQLGNKAADRIHSEVDSRKDNAVGQARSVSSAIDRAAGEMDPNTPDWLKSALKQGAQKIQSFADNIEQKDSRELLRDAQDFARDNPGTFLTACAFAGFAAARILKAGGEQQGAQVSQGRQSNEPSYPGVPLGTPSRPQTAKTTGEFA